MSTRPRPSFQDTPTPGANWLHRLVRPPYATEEELRIAAEVRSEGGTAYEALRAKCRWEKMGQLAVIREWGDPRKWPNDGDMPQISARKNSTGEAL